MRCLLLKPLVVVRDIRGASLPTGDSHDSQLVAVLCFFLGGGGRGVWPGREGSIPHPRRGRNRGTPGRHQRNGVLARWLLMY